MVPSSSIAVERHTRVGPKHAVSTPAMRLDGFAYTLHPTAAGVPCDVILSDQPVRKILS